ncbi:MAG: translation initiation factor IF-2 subunit beta [Candidatus Nanoarchaeia archaeon]|nr:translation initiation factor IF-2 subunit beta [Candidatus Nanoarchaeia archaeon]
MDYNEMLKKARETMPEISISKSRFEVPEPNVANQGKKTVLLNFNKITEYIQRDTDDILKFLTRELATSAVIEGHKAVFTGKFSRKQIADKINRYVSMYVKCGECGRFETKLKKEDRITYMECMACGAKKPVIV